MKNRYSYLFILVFGMSMVFVDLLSFAKDTLNVSKIQDFDNILIVSYYGRPYSHLLGVMGENSIPETARRIKQKAEEYKGIFEGLKVIPAFHIIYGLVKPGGKIHLLSNKTVLEYIEYAEQNNMLVILDHQIGKDKLDEATIHNLVQWLKYPNVHLAIDPEWATSIPLQIIGSVTAERINHLQNEMVYYLEKENIITSKMLIIHQFYPNMIIRRDNLKTNKGNVYLILNFDGFGTKSLKKAMYENLIKKAKNLPLKGFKLFYPKPLKNKIPDKPLMSPEEVLNLTPRPVYINYQ